MGLNAEERRELQFQAAATNYLWGAYVDAGSEFEEVEELVKLLKKTRSDALEEAARIAESNATGKKLSDHDEACKDIAAAIRALKTDGKEG